MKTTRLSILAIALTAATFAGACNRAEKTADTSYEAKPPATDTAPPATDTTTPPSMASGTNTASTDTASAMGTQPTTATPPTTEASEPAKTTANATTSFDDIDTNKDGAISRNELTDTNPLLQNFSTADKDGNGTLSRAEVEAQRGTMPPAGG